MKNSENTSHELYDLLVSKNLDPDTLDSRGTAVDDVSDAEIFSFDFEVDNTNYGTVVIALSGDNEFEVYYGDNLGKAMEKDHKTEWYKFLAHLKTFATRNLMKYTLKDFTKLKHGMRKMNSVNEGIFEGYYGGKKTSYNKVAKGAKLKIRHSKKLEDADPRYRFVEQVFVETNDGQRFKLPFKNLNAAKAMVRHVSEGGNPYDAFGQHIHSLVKEMNSITHFARKHSRNLDEDVVNLVDDAKKRRTAIKRIFSSLQSKGGYNKYHEAWTPDNDDSIVERMETFEANYYPVDDAVKVFESWIEEGYKSPEEAAAFEKGKKAARSGKKYSDNPYEKGTQEYLYWSKGHNAVREDVDEEKDNDTGNPVRTAERDPMLESFKKIIDF